MLMEYRAHYCKQYILMGFKIRFYPRKYVRNKTYLPGSYAVYLLCVILIESGQEYCVCVNVYISLNMNVLTLIWRNVI